MTRSLHRYVTMHLAPDPDADPYTVRATCGTCVERSPAPDPQRTISQQYEQAMQWCNDHAATDHPDGRHLRFVSTATVHWRVTPSEDIGPEAP
ncbi:hypothetical protein ACMA1D_21525 [Streptomyces sp. 796.1]|uniref:DUF7848 domain-containing protein n=1 Tax=Streptomyces sp. 796.1 TaxID=3163029 RepID=UPI0039C904F0